MSEDVSHRVALDAWRTGSPAGGGGVRSALDLEQARKRNGESSRGEAHGGQS